MKKSLFLFLMVGAVSYAANVVNVKVEALDNFGGNTDAALVRCQTKPGTAFDPATLTRDVSVLKDSGEFQEVTADAHRTAEGVEVTFKVYRKMRYQGPLVVKGNEEFSLSKISEEAGLKDGRLYGEADLAEAAAKVRALYRRKDFPDAKVTPIPRVLSDGNTCTVTFIIDEGKEQKLGKWLFKGVKKDDKNELDELLGNHPWWDPEFWFEDETTELLAEIGVFPWWNYRHWFGDEPSSDSELVEAAQKVKAKCANLGYLDANVTGPEFVLSDSGKFDRVFVVDLGPKYFVGDVKVEGVTTYSTEDVIEKSKLPARGDVAGEKALEDAAHRISVIIGSGDSGLADTRVDVNKIPSEEDPTVLDVVFKVTEGVPVVINQVRIEGNDYTKDKVIRREISLAPGNRMLADKAEDSKMRLENLDYFSRVRHYLRETDLGKDANGSEYRDLVYEVEERNTGDFMVGVGASSVDSVYFSAEVQQANFDLFAPDKLFRGGGQKGRLYVQAGPRVQTYEAAVTEPHLFDRLLELTVEGYRRQRWYDEYDIIRSGAAVTLSYPVKFWPTWKPFGSFGVRLSGELIQFDDVEHGQWLFNNKPVSLDREQDEYDDAFEAVAHFFWGRDTRDNFRMPTSGSRTRVFFDLGTGDNEYWRAGFNYRHYFKMVEKYNHILMFSFRAETIDAISDDVPIYNRYFLGGPRSIRGFEYRYASPLAKKVNGSSYMPWGGQTLTCLNVEYTIPVFKMLRLAFFSDMGAVGEDEFDFDFGDNFAWSAGIGFRIDIPRFPIRLDFATPIEKPDNAEKEAFSFSIGYDF